MGNTETNSTIYPSDYTKDTDNSIFQTFIVPNCKIRKNKEML